MTLSQKYEKIDFALSDIRKHSHLLFQLAQDKSPQIRRYLLMQLSDCDDCDIKVSRTIALSLLHDKSEEVRCSAIDLLALNAQLGDAPLFHQALKDNSWIVRHSALLALTETQLDTFGFEIFRVLVHEEHFVIRRDAVQLLVDFHPSWGQPLLHTLLPMEKDTIVKISMLIGLIRLGENDKIEEVLNQLLTDDRGVQEQVFILWNKITSPETSALAKIVIHRLLLEPLPENQHNYLADFDNIYLGNRLREHHAST